MKKILTHRYVRNSITALMLAVLVLTSESVIPALADCSSFDCLRDIPFNGSHTISISPPHDAGTISTIYSSSFYNVSSRQNYPYSDTGNTVNTYPYPYHNVSTARQDTYVDIPLDSNTGNPAYPHHDISTTRSEIGTVTTATNATQHGTQRVINSHTNYRNTNYHTTNSQNTECWSCSDQLNTSLNTTVNNSVNSSINNSINNSFNTYNNTSNSYNNTYNNSSHAYNTSEVGSISYTSAPLVFPTIQYAYASSGCQQDIYSNISDYATMGQDTTHAVATYNGNSRWTASVPGATWIWKTYYVQHPLQDETTSFTKSFSLPSNPTSATLRMAADNSYIARVNNTIVGSQNTEVNYMAGTEHIYNVASYLHAGTNSISFTVTNWGLENSDALSNPAGLLYKLHINMDQSACTVSAPSVTLLASPASITAGDSVTLSWTSSGATFCYASGSWSGTKATSGSETTSPGSTSTYTLTCSNGSASGSDSKTISVNQPTAMLASATTNAATGISQTNATLNGYVNPNGTNNTVRWFEYGQTTSFGQSTNHVNQGSSAGNFSEDISGLQSNTTYYFRAVAKNSAGIVHGSTFNFSTDNQQYQLPAVTTQSAGSIGDSNATLNGYVNPNGTYDTKRWFEYGQTNLFGQSTNQINQGSNAGNFSGYISGLQSNTTYYFRTIAQNSAGIVRGSTLSFTTGNGSTQAQLPSITTNSTTGISQTSATLNGYVNPNGTNDTVRWFEYGQTSSFGQSTGIITHGSGAGNYYAYISGLQQGMTYYFRAVAQNSAGIVRGSTLTFTTDNQQQYSHIPSVTTQSPSSVNDSTVTLNGYVNPNGTGDTTRWFEFGPTTALSQSTPQFNQGYSAGNFSQAILGLNQNTTYYYRAVAQNSAGIVRGSIMTFSTFRQNVAPIAITNAPTFVAQTTAILNGSVIADSNISTDGWFEWGYSPLLGQQTNRRNLGAISSANLTDSINGLQPNTTYFYRAVTQNANGISRGSVINFRTQQIFILPEPVPPQPILQPRGFKNLTITESIYNPTNPNTQGIVAYASGGDTVQYTVHIKNTGTLDLRGGTITLPISPYVDYITSSDNGLFNPNTREVSWNLPSLIPQRVTAVTVNVRTHNFAQEFTVDTVARVIADGISKQSNPVTLIFNQNQGIGFASPVSLSLSTEKQSYAMGEKAIFRITYKNTSNFNLNNVMLAVTLPPELSYDQMLITQTGAENNVSVNGAQVMLQIGNLMAGESGYAVLSTTVRSSGDGSGLFTTVANLNYRDPSGVPGTESASIQTALKQNPGLASLLGNNWLLALIIALFLLPLLILLLLIIGIMYRRYQDTPTRNTKLSV